MKNLGLFRLHQVAIFTLLALAVQNQSMANEQNSDKQDSFVVSAQALKVNTALQETPKSVSIITEQDLTIHAPQKIDEALRYTSGVVAQPYGADNDTDWFKVRGFDAATYLDNSRLYRDGYYTWLLEPYGLESIEVVKGSSAVLFGESTPGGAVNLVTKKPSINAKNEIFLEAGNNDHQALGFDLSTASSDAGARYRLVGTMKKSDGELKDTDNKRIYLAPSAAFDLSDQTVLTLMGTYLHDDGTPTNPFFPAAGTLIHSNYGKIKPSTNLGEPDYDKYKRTQFSVGYLLEHQFNDEWRFAQRVNYGYNDLTLRSVYAFFNADPAVQELERGVVFRDGKNQSFSLDNNIVGEWDSERFENTLLAGIEFQYHQTKGDEQDNYAFGKINPWKPVYGHYTPLDPSNNIHRTIDKTQTSIYSQYQTKLDSKWIGVIGARYDWVKTENKAHKKAEDESRNDGQMSLNAGLMYIADNGISPYLNYSQSFEVQSTIDPTTQKLYKPLKGEQFEAGIKYTPYFVDGYWNIAWFDIEQKNALVTNPKTFIATQTGKVTSQGIETELFASVTDNWDIKATYTYTNAQTDNTGGKGRKQAGIIPKHMATVWTDYEIPIVSNQSLKLGTGIRYYGQSKDNPASSNLSVPSATLWDMAAIYQLSNNWQFQFNMNNILNKEYVSSCDYWCYYGQSRSFVLQTKYTW